MFTTGEGYVTDTNVWGRSGQVQPQEKVINNLTDEEIKSLTSQNDQFSLRLTQREFLRGICNHRLPGGVKDAFVTEPDGRLRCTICNYVVDPVDINVGKEDIEHAVEVVENILQTIKMIYPNMPIDAAREYFQIIPLMGKIPELFSIAVANFMKHENASGWNNGNRGEGTVQLYNMFANMFGGGMVGQPGMGSPMGSAPAQGEPLYNRFGQVVGYQNPSSTVAPQAAPGTVGTANPAFGAGPLGSGNPENPFVNGPAYQSQTKDFAYTAGQDATTVTTATDDGQTVTATSTLKA